MKDRIIAYIKRKLGIASPSIPWMVSQAFYDAFVEGVTGEPHDL